jgi:hypothetical protein
MHGLFIVACDILYFIIAMDLHNIVLIRLQNNGLYLPLQQHFLSPIVGKQYNAILNDIDDFQMDWISRRPYSIKNKVSEDSADITTRGKKYLVILRGTSKLEKLQK